MQKYLLFLSLFSLSFLKNTYAQQESLKQEIIHIAEDAKGTVGVALLNFETGYRLDDHGSDWLVMQSVFKFPIAVTVLRLVDQGKYKLDQRIHITKEDLPKNYSPLRDKYPDGNIDLSLAELLGYVISLSDNNVCDILLRKVTSKEEVEQYMKKLGLKGIEVRASESEMLANWKAQFTDRAKPLDLLRLMELTYKGEILTADSKAFLWKIMLETSTTPKRLKGLLPAGTLVAHKSGTSATDNNGISPATNDIGIITLPNGQHLALVVMVCNSAADKETRDAVIARIAKAAYDHEQLADHEQK